MNSLMIKLCLHTKILYQIPLNDNEYKCITIDNIDSCIHCI